MRLGYCILKMSQYGTTEKQVKQSITRRKTDMIDRLDRQGCKYTQRVDVIDDFVFVGNLLHDQSYAE